MAAHFSRTFAALRPDRASEALLAGTVAIALLIAWTVWMFKAQVAVYRTCTQARLEVSPGPTRVAASVAGTVLAVHLTVGAAVTASEILLELDATAERIALERSRGQLAALEPEVASVARELAAEAAAGLSGTVADSAALRETAARERAAEAGFRLAEEEEVRVRKLVEGASTPAAALSRAVGDLRERRATHEAFAHERAVIEAERRQRESIRRARREQLERLRVELEASLAATRADLARLTYEVERRTVRAPVAGSLGEVASLRPGSVVAAGSVIATLVPNGVLQVIAMYQPAAIGRIAPGQRAQLRLDGFPWTHYGTVGAHVLRVGNELREGVFRVELALAPSQRIPLHHGMTGAVDVEIERASPYALLVRAVGRRGDAVGHD